MKKLRYLDESTAYVYVTFIITEMISLILTLIRWKDMGNTWWIYQLIPLLFTGFVVISDSSKWKSRRKWNNTKKNGKRIEGQIVDYKTEMEHDTDNTFMRYYAVVSYVNLGRRNEVIYYTSFKF